MDTIYAPSTPIGGAIAVVRASGPDCARALTALCGRDLSAVPRQVTHTPLYFSGAVIDDAMAVYYAAPHSYTGENMFELYCHGGPAVVRDVLAALGALALRAAEPGEFTRRAFLNGKLDLAQAEAVMDLIQSSAQRAARAALEQMQGRLSREIAAVEDALTDALAGVGAAIDYPDELEEDVFSGMPDSLSDAITALDTLIAQGQSGRVLREGLRVVLLGRPNAGKSSLLNALLGFERAIVTPQPGTTRDVLEEQLSLDGIPLRLFDTAGLREAENEAERIGVERARDALKRADVAVVLLDDSEPLSQEDFDILTATADTPRILLYTKTDLPGVWGRAALAALVPPEEELLPVSARTGEGLNTLCNRIRSLAGPIEGAYVTNARHIAALEEARRAVIQSLSAADADCVSTDLRDALAALGRITGRAVDDAVLDRIFERFCVGK